MGFRFHKFPLYTNIKSFVADVYKLTKLLPQEENFELCSQLRRAATSIILNLAEGSMRKSDAEFNRFILYCLGSVGEIVAILDICLELKYISSSIHEEFMVKCEAIAKQLYGFSKKLKST